MQQLELQPRQIHTAARNVARNCLRHARGKDSEPFQVPKIGICKSEFFLTCAKPKVTTMRAATWHAAATHPRSCAQPRAQLREACAWQGFGFSSGSQNQNLEIRVFLTFAITNLTTMCAATLAAAAIHPHSCAQPRAQLLEACAWQELGTSGGSQNRNMKIIVFENNCKSQPTAVGAAT